MTTIETITTEQIESLRDEALEHGDERMADTCADALDTAPRFARVARRAREICAEVITEAATA